LAVGKPEYKRLLILHLPSNNYINLLSNLSVSITINHRTTFTMDNMDNNAKGQETIDLANEVIDTHLSNMSSWGSLPAELRLVILELLAQEKSGLASYAQVCKEWQAVIEKKNFGRLKLRASCLDDFEHMVNRQRGLVKHIWLNIELRAYTCRNCWTISSNTSQSLDNSIARVAISKLFSILSTWNPASDGLTLEISAQPPSDSERWFKSRYFGADDVDEDAYFGSQLQKTTSKLHDLKHCWVDGQQVAPPEVGAILRLYEEVRLNFKEELPKVDAVTHFVLRRQCRRRFAPRTLGLLLDKPPRLECLVYKP
jgi:hypothetical protein